MFAAQFLDTPTRFQSFVRELRTALKVYGIVVLAALSGGLIALIFLETYATARVFFLSKALTWRHSLFLDIMLFGGILAMAVWATIVFELTFRGRALSSELRRPKLAFESRHAHIDRENAPLVIDPVSIDEIARAVEARLHHQETPRAKEAYRGY